MSEKNWFRVTRHVKVAFSSGCDGQGHMRGQTWDLKCRDAGYAHGHAELADDEDGTCWLPFPVASQEGLREALARCGNSFTDEEKEAILALDEVRALPEQLTAGEAAILNDPARLDPFTKFGFVFP